MYRVTIDSDKSPFSVQHVQLWLLLQHETPPAKIAEPLQHRSCSKLCKHLFIRNSNVNKPITDHNDSKNIPPESNLNSIVQGQGHRQDAGQKADFVDHGIPPEEEPLTATCSHWKPTCPTHCQGWPEPRPAQRLGQA